MNEAERIAFFGTAEATPEIVRLAAGRLSAEFEAGQLRYIRWRGLEVIRAVAFVIRDGAWGTLAQTIDTLSIASTPERFEIAFTACVDGFGFSARIVGEAGGDLVFSASGSASGAPFVTNRTGFIVLHPLEGVVGREITIEHVDGGRAAMIAPRVISPFQPATDIASLTHSPAPGLTVTCGMEGDAFEMEDHRNWGDASFKTYVRPLARGFPYTLEPGVSLDQAVTIEIRDDGFAPPPAEEARSVDVATMPGIGLAIDAAEVEDAMAHADRLRGLALRHLLARLDPDDGEAQAGALASFAAAIGAPLFLECVIAGRDPEAELGAAARRIASAGLDPAAVFPIPVRDFRSRPRGVPQGEADDAAILAAARAAFPSARLMGGSPSLFTELNRNPPPDRGRALDIVSHGFSATIHAADDRSVIETLESLPAIADSVEALCPGVARHIGVAAIGLRHNPYGAAPIANPRGVRMAAAGIDPRHAAEFGARYALAFAGVAAMTGVAHLTLGMVTGPLGVLGPDGGLTPLGAAIGRLAAMAGRPARVTWRRGEAVIIDGAGGALEVRHFP
jgi:hypothetical protein